MDWKLSAPNGAPAWYDPKSCTLRTRRRVEVMRALLERTSGAVQGGAEVLHELVHLQQDICTGWGLYNSEVLVAMTIARGGVLAEVAKRDPAARPPLISSDPEHRAPAAFSEYMAYRRLWSDFAKRAGTHTPMTELHVIESQAHAYQIVQHILAEDYSSVARLLSAEDAYTHAFALTRHALGFDSGVSADRMLLILWVHQVLCDMAFAAPPPRSGSPIQPATASVDELRHLMPQGLATRLELIAADAFGAFSTIAEEFAAAEAIEFEDVLNVIERVKRHDHWLGSVEVCVGDELAQRWMSVFESAASLTLANVGPNDDPVRAYRAWAMRHWDPFAPLTTPESALLKVMRRIPAFRLADDDKTQWYFELDQERARSEHLNAVTVDRFLGRVAADLDGRMMLHELSTHFLHGHAKADRCNQLQACGEVTAACRESFLAGMKRGCHVDALAETFLRMPASMRITEPKE